MPSDAAECQEKRQRVVEYLDSHGLDAVVLTRRCNFAWFTGGGLNHVGTGGEVGVASLVISRPKRTVCVTSWIEERRVLDEELSVLGFAVQAYPWHDPESAARLWRDVLGDLRAACDVRVAGLPETVGLLGGDFDCLRWSLTDKETVRIRALARETAACLEETCRRARRGMAEHELAGRLAGSLLERGIRVPTLLAAADDRATRYRHPIPTTARFDRYGLVAVGAERGGLIVSCTRLFSFGPIDEDLRRRHEAVCRVDAAMIGATHPCSTLGEVFAVAQRVYAESGFPDEWRRHHQGGSTGYLPREVKAVPGDTTPVLSGQAFAWNPSIAGTKSEDTILTDLLESEILTATGAWPTTSYPGGGKTYPRCDIMER
ncbi:MAG TPA: M24 family metallopeptidase [Phycisphaerae bacterium]|nr:M24 family metallopeptidase [Phycisphaerae bacterium]HRY67014.1 M24 family metallopeptidase [Phycisphaerae bacterium]HSA28853.1 M24 family metallopeptidase [Phycisphaerae bacterium]